MGIEATVIDSFMTETPELNIPEPPSFWVERSFQNVWQNSPKNVFRSFKQRHVKVTYKISSWGL